MHACMHHAPMQTPCKTHANTTGGHAFQRGRPTPSMHTPWQGPWAKAARGGPRNGQSVFFQRKAAPRNTHKAQNTTKPNTDTTNRQPRGPATQAYPHLNSTHSRYNTATNTGSHVTKKTLPCPQKSHKHKRKPRAHSRGTPTTRPTRCYYSRAIQACLKHPQAPTGGHTRDHQRGGVGGAGRGRRGRRGQDGHWRGPGRAVRQHAVYQ